MKKNDEKLMSDAERAAAVTGETAGRATVKRATVKRKTTEIATATHADESGGDKQNGGGIDAAESEAYFENAASELFKTDADGVDVGAVSGIGGVDVGAVSGIGGGIGGAGENDGAGEREGAVRQALQNLIDLLPLYFMSVPIVSENSEISVLAVVRELDIYSTGGKPERTGRLPVGAYLCFEPHFGVSACRLTDTKEPPHHKLITGLPLPEEYGFDGNEPASVSRIFYSIMLSVDWSGGEFSQKRREYTAGTIRAFWQLPAASDGAENEPDSPYFHIPSTAVTNMVKKIMNSPNRLESQRPVKITAEPSRIEPQDMIIRYRGKTETLDFTAENFKKLFAKSIRNGARIFTFLLKRSNEQGMSDSTRFTLADLCDAGIYSSPDSAYRGVKNVLDKLYAISVEGALTVYEGRGKKREVRAAKTRILTAYDVSYTQCRVTLSPIIRDNTPFFTVLPDWCFGLASDDAFMLLDYIFYLARQNKQRRFSVSLDAVRRQLGLPAPDETTHHSQLIVEPIDRAVTEIEDYQNLRGTTEIKITPEYPADWRSVEEFLNGCLWIDVGEVKELQRKSEKC